MKARLSLLVAACLALGPSLARADVIPPCDQIAADPSCTQALVGKLCPDKKTVCSAVPCGVNEKGYQCQQPCPVQVEDTDKVCGDASTGGDKAAIGKACGADGTCGYDSCAKGAPTVRCYKPGPLPPDEQGQGGGGQGGSATAGQAGSATAGGESKSDDDSGCTVATAGVGRQGALAGLMLALGAAALLADRRRR